MIKGSPKNDSRALGEEREDEGYRTVVDGIGGGMIAQSGMITDN